MAKAVQVVVHVQLHLIIQLCVCASGGIAWHEMLMHFTMLHPPLELEEGDEDGFGSLGSAKRRTTDGDVYQRTGQAVVNVGLL